jgi:GNAT superfamily N-acetyltransferase
LANERDIKAMIALERRATELFRTIGYDFVADAEVTDADEHRNVMRNGATIAAEAPDGALAGFAMLTVLDGDAHLDEIDVDPAHQQRGLARALIGKGELWAMRKGFDAITLTTYRDVPWNGPFYRRLGYLAFEPEPRRKELRSLIEKEAGWGFAAKPRIAMRKKLKR